MLARRASLKTGHRYEFICLQLDIAGHSKLSDAERILHAAKERFHDQVNRIVATHDGQPFKWEGDGGAFLFTVTDGREFDESVLAAFRILESLPGLNKELRQTAGLTQDLSVRVSLDSGQAIFNQNPGLITGDFLNAFLKNERAISLVDAVTITERVHRQLSETLRGRFAEFKRSQELGCRIYRTESADSKAAPEPTATPQEPPPHHATPPQYSVFLAHDGTDRPAIEELARRLMREGIEPWLDTWNLIPGDPWQPAIEEVLMDCGAVAIFVGPGPLGLWQHEQMRASIARQVEERQPGKKFRVIPVLLPGAGRPDAGRLPPFLRKNAWVEFRETLDDPEAFHRLVCGIKGLPPRPLHP
jgi:hypothetical protein